MKTAYQNILEDLRQGYFLPGQQLRERELASRYQMSRTPIRAAFQLLIDEGMLKKVPKKGVYVGKGSLDSKNIRERLELIELLLIHYLFTLEKNEIDFDTQHLDLIWHQLWREELHSPKTILNFFEAILINESNDYMKLMMLQTVSSLFDYENEMFIEIVSKHRVKILNALNKLIKHLSIGRYSDARREIRVMTNQLVLEIIHRLIDF